MYNENDLPMMAEAPVERLGKPEMEQPKEYEPSHNEALRRYEIKIRFLNRGCVVFVGCKDIAFEKVEDAISAIQTYVAHPYNQQQAWSKILD